MSRNDIIPPLLITAMSVCVMEKFKLYNVNFESSEAIMHLISDPLCRTVQKISKPSDDHIIQHKVYNALMRTLQRKKTLLDSCSGAESDEVSLSTQPAGSNIYNGLVYRTGQRQLLNEAILAAESLLGAFLDKFITPKIDNPVSYPVDDMYRSVLCFKEEEKLVCSPLVGAKRKTEFFRWPLEKTISTEAAESDPVFASYLVYIDGADDDTILILYIIFICFVSTSEDHVETRKVLQNYKNLYSSTPLLWSSEEVEMLGSDSKAVSLLALQKSDLADLYHQMFKVPAFQHHSFTLENFLWASNIVSNFAVSCHNNDDRLVTFIIPLKVQPQFNHFSNAHYEIRDNAACLVADKNFECNEPIYIPVEVDRCDNANLIFLGHVIDSNPLETIYVNETMMNAAIMEAAKHAGVVESVSFQIISERLNASGLIMWWRSHNITGNSLSPLPNGKLIPVPVKLINTLQLATTSPIQKERNLDNESRGIIAAIKLILGLVEKDMEAAIEKQERLISEDKTTSSRHMLASKYCNYQLELCNKVKCALLHE